jgi:hypothetical protein
LASTLGSLSALDIPLVLPSQKPKEIHSANSEVIRTKNGYCVNTDLQLRQETFSTIVLFVIFHTSMPVQQKRKSKKDE